MKIIPTLVLAACGSVMALAAPVKYANVGEVAPTYTFTATNTADEIAYFYGSTAGFLDMVGLWVNGQQRGGFVLPNHTSSTYGTTAATFGESFDFGKVSAGDTLVFALQVSPEYVYPTSGRAPYVVTSDPSLNKDHVNHTYTQAFAGETRNGATIAPGTYISFEDLLLPNSDLNYNDENVVFSNVTATLADPTPEPSSLALLGLGLISGAFGIFRKRRRG